MMVILFYLARKRHVEGAIVDMESISHSNRNTPMTASVEGGRKMSFDTFGERFVWRKNSD